MKSTTTSTLRFPFLAAVLIFVLAAATQAVAQSGQKVTGGGTIEEDGDTSSFSLNAIEHKDGTASGHLVYHYRAGNLTITMQIDCVNVIGGNRASVGGFVTEVRGDAPPIIFVGARAVMGLRDGGEGRNKPLTDRISDLIFPIVSPPDCKVFVPITRRIVTGNIQIKQ